MEAEAREPGEPKPAGGGYRKPGTWLSGALILIGGLLVVGAALYGGPVVLNAWAAKSDHYLVVDQIAAWEDLALGLSGHLSPVSPAQSPTPNPTVGQPNTDEPELEETGTAGALAITPGPDEQMAPADGVPLHTGIEGEATATPTPDAPVRIQIPALSVDRSIVPLPLVQDPRTGAWDRDIDSLLSRPGKDLVGHWGGSAYPGQAGNTILVGHNYGYGYNAVFVRLGQLKQGQNVIVITEAGQTLTYQVKTVTQLQWRRQDAAELARHQEFLAVGGAERLTLVTCGGAVYAPYPLRIYVVAEPVREETQPGG